MLGKKYVINFKQLHRQILIKMSLESAMGDKKVIFLKWIHSGDRFRRKTLFSFCLWLSVCLSVCLSVYIDILYV